MEPPQFGESSKSPQRPSSPSVFTNGGGATTNSKQMEDRMSRLILGNWDVPPEKHIHPSHDLISLLHLEGLYNLYVRPFADAIGAEDDIKVDDEVDGIVKPKRKVKKVKLEKGYTHLLEDCMDPTPMGDQKDNISIMPLIPDRLDLNFPQEAPDFGPRPQMLSDDAFANAFLEAGQKVEGYEHGVKKGVQEEKAKRDRRRQLRQAQIQAKPAPLSIPALPSPKDPSAPPTPGLPVQPPGPPYSNNPLRKPFLPPRPSGVPGTPGGPPRSAPPGRPFTPNGPPRGSPMYRGGVPGTPGQRPFQGPRPGSFGASTPRSVTPGGGKRPGEPLQNANLKRSKPTGGSRSASPMPPQSTTQYNPASHGRPGTGKQPRSQTEG